MNTTRKALAVAAALVVSTASQAALQNFETFNSSLAFFAVDATDQASVTVNLGYLFDDVSTAAFTTPGTKIQWDFSNNSLSINGVAQSGTYNWSTPYNFFATAAVAANTQWGVVAGKAGNYPDYFLTTGNPTANQLATMATAGTMPNMTGLSPMYSIANQVLNTSTRKTTQTLTGFGANSVVGEVTQASGYAGAGANLGSKLDWGGQLKWTAGVAVGGSAPLWSMDDDTNNIFKIGSASGTPGNFTFNGGVLTWTVTAVPDAEAGLLAATGLSVLWFARRRRRAA